MSNQYTRQQFYKYSEGEKKLLAETYVENKKILDRAGIPYTGQNGTIFEVRARGTFTTLAPYDGQWIMEMPDGEKLSGRGFVEFIHEFRKRL